MNAAVWFGGAVFFSFVAAPGLFQPALKRLLHDYYVGSVAQLLQERYFLFHLVCGGIALLHTLALRLLRHRESQRAVLGVLGGILLLSLIGKFLLLPTMSSLFQAKYSAPTWQQRGQAEASFRRWHAASQVLNLFVLGGLGFYLWRMAGAMEENRYATPLTAANPFAGTTRL